MKNKTINIALQGGGAFTAYAWGILDKFLEDGRISFDGISATSGGSVTASVMMQGFLNNGNDGARELLHDFWHAISQSGNGLGLNAQTMLDHYIAQNIPPLGLMIFQNTLKMYSPYQFNPFDVNPLRDILNELVDFDEIQKRSHINLFICATNVSTGKIKIFDKSELSLNAVLASACTPYLFKAVTIDDQSYWDGGYIGNPAIYPLIYNTNTKDIVIVNVTRLRRAEVPTTIEDINDRSREIAFNSSLMRELRAIAFVNKIIVDGCIKEEHLDRFTLVNLHAIQSDATLNSYPSINMLNTEWGFLTKIRDVGRQAAAKWLEENFKNIGKKSTLDLDSWL